MTLTVVEFVGGQGMSDDDAKRIGPFLAARFGEANITPANVVAVARPKDSPIHRDFVWNDAVAAGMYRLEEARKMLRSIKVVFVNGETRPPTRAYHQVTMVEADEGQHRVYVAAQVVWRTPALADQVKEKALGELRGWAARYREYTSLSGLADRIDQLVLAELAS